MVKSELEQRTQSGTRRGSSETNGEIRVNFEVVSKESRMSFRRNGVNEIVYGQ